MMSRAPRRRGMLAGCAVTPSRPKWSIAMDAITCPARNRPTVVAAPRCGVRTIEAHTKKAPSRPPSHIHQGAFMMGPSSGTERRTTAVVANRITVPTRNESAAASTGPPTTWRSWLLMANCVGAAIPATSAAGRSRSQIILFTLLSSCASSTGLVHVVEDRLYAVIANARTVLNVAGALQVGQGRLHPVFEAGDLVFEIGQFVRVEDHVLLVVVLPHLPQPAPERVGLRRKGLPLHISTCFPGACEARTRRAKARVRGASLPRA